MKIFFLTLCLAGPVLLAPCLGLADDATANLSASGNSAGTANTADDRKPQRREKAKEAFEELGLTDAQKAQIKQIRASTEPGKERRQQIMALLTPDQKSKLIAMFKAHRGESQGGE